MKVQELMEHGFDQVSLPDGEREIDGVYIGDLLSWVMGRAQMDNAWITIMNNVNVLAVASLVDLSAVVLAEGVTLSEKDAASAQEKGINVYTSEKSTYELCRLAGELTK